MKTKIILIIVLFAGMISQLQAQDSDPAIDSMIAKQAEPIIQANTQLVKELPSIFLRTRDLRAFQRVIAKKNESMEFIRDISMTNDVSEKLMYVKKAQKKYNEARKLFEKNRPKSWKQKLLRCSS